MKTGYALNKVAGPGLVILDHAEYGRQMWTIVKVRKHKKCVYDGVDLYLKEAYSPITNGSNRMDRISILAMDRIIRPSLTPTTTL